MEADVDLFVRSTKKSPFVHFQGHPEYSMHTLLKEYRRDIKRFLRGERETYPSMPQGYLDGAAPELLNGFRERALSDRREEIIESFPESVVRGLQNTWQSSATCVYRNWLRYVVSRKADTSPVATFARVRSARSASTNHKLA
jgi:homoserine O-succinyltransferase/O-acetyltransferase